MFNKKCGILIFIFLLTLFFTLSGVSANDIDGVENNYSSNESVKSFTDLGNEINGNLNKTEIILGDDFEYCSDEYFSPIISINRSLTIDGQGHVIDAKNQRRIFEINSVNVVLKNINFINARVRFDGGGAIYFNSTSNGTIINSTFINCIADYRGGAIFYSDYSNCTIINSTFINNSAMNGGAVACYNNTKSFIENSIFINNTSCRTPVYGWGGAVYYAGNDTGVIKNSIFINSSATLSGGAVFYNFYSKGLIINSTFINSSVVDEKGGSVAYYDYANGTIINSTFMDNTAVKGGAIYYTWRSSSVINSTFINNNAKEGGAIYYNKGSRNTVENSTFIENSAINGGAIYYFDKTKGTVMKSIFIENTANVGGAICYFNESSKSIVEESIFIKNSAENGSVVYGGTVFNSTIIKITPTVITKPITTVYNNDDYLIIVLKDHKLNPISGVEVDIGIGGVLQRFISDINGQINVPTKNLVPKSYDISISSLETDKYDSLTVNTQIIVKKCTLKILAKKKTFKLKIKTKKYVIVIKDDKNKVIPNIAVTLKINGKVFKAISNKKGVATFKLTKMFKKGKFKGVLKFKGNKYYNSFSKKAKILIKK